MGGREGRRTCRRVSGNGKGGRRDAVRQAGRQIDRRTDWERGGGGCEMPAAVGPSFRGPLRRLNLRDCAMLLLRRTVAGARFKQEDVEDNAAMVKMRSAAQMCAWNTSLLAQHQKYHQSARAYSVRTIELTIARADQLGRC